MQIQKGLVKYKDRTDIVCTYGMKEYGSQYYFLDETSMPNGNIIASTVLVEAIDPVVVASSVGVIDSNGNVVIPFENRSIKVISEGFLLVEKADITTQSVLEAISLRSDPLAATRLVTTPAAIKDNMYLKMGNDGRFVFNDQFSEASIFDIYGNNILNNEYFSFIAVKDGILYLSKNTVDSPVLQFSLVSLEYIEDKVEVVEEPLDVSSVEIPKEMIDTAMSADVEQKFGDADITAADFESANNVSLDAGADSSLANDSNESNVEVVSSVEDSSVSEDVYSKDIVEPVVAESLVIEEPVVNEVNVDEITSSIEVADDVIGFSDEVKDIKPRRSTRESASFDATDIKEKVVDDIKPVIEDNNTSIEQDLVSFDFGDSISYDDKESVADFNFEISDEDEKSVEIEPAVDEFAATVDSNVKDFKNSLFEIELEDDDIFANSDKDTIIDDVAATVSNLIKLNRSQREKILAYEEKIDQIVVTHKKVVERAKVQARDAEVLKAKLKNYESAVPRFEAKIQLLEEKIQEQERMISNQLAEIERLKPQVESRKELARILADAQSFLDQAN